MAKNIYNRVMAWW